MRLRAALVVAALLLALPSAAGAACDVALDPIHLVGDSGEPAYQHSWHNSNVGSFGSSYFRRDPFGRVSLYAPISGGVDNSIAFTLPEGYRPFEPLFAATLGDGGMAGTYVHVAVNGDVFIVLGASANIFVDVSFDTDSVTEAPFDCSLSGGDGDAVAYAAQAQHSDIWFLSGLVAAFLPGFALYRAIVV